MAQQMEAEMQRSQTMQMQEDMDSLRDILENLHTLSFDQEQLMKDFKGVNLSDPRFVQLAQKQIKLQDDSKVIEDSLYALANRVLEIQSFITRELNNMKYYMDESARNIKDRKLPMVAPNQQFAMTSANNLALMLSDVFQRMQEALAMAMMMPGKGDKSESGNSPGEMQQQLNQQMREMGRGAKREKVSVCRSNWLGWPHNKLRFERWFVNSWKVRKGMSLVTNTGNSFRRSWSKWNSRRRK